MDYQQILSKGLESAGYIKYKVQSCTVLLCCREEARKQWIDNMHSAMPVFCHAFASLSLGCYLLCFPICGY